MSRYFRFGLRTILILTTIAAALFAWLGRDIIRARREKPIIDRIVNAGGTVYYDYQAQDEFPNVIDSSIQQSNQPQWLRYLFGENFGANVLTVTARGTASGDDVKDVHQLHGIRDISLHGRAFTDKCIDDLIKVQQLRGVSISETSISPAGLARLASCRELVSISLWGPEIEDDHLKAVAGIPSVQHLQVICSSITDEGLKHFAERENLATLEIYVAAITDAGLKSLVDLPKLRKLDLLGTSVTDQSMPTIGGFRSLCQLRLDAHSISDEGLTFLARNEKLEVLLVRGCPIDGTGFAKLCELQNLRLVDASSTNINDEGLAAIADLPSLVELEILDSKVTGKGLQHLERSEQLRSLLISITDELTLDDAKALKAKLPNCQIGWVETDRVTGNVNSGEL